MIRLLLCKLIQNGRLYILKRLSSILMRSLNFDSPRLNCYDILLKLKLLLNDAVVFEHALGVQLDIIRAILNLHGL